MVQFEIEFLICFTKPKEERIKKVSKKKISKGTPPSPDNSKPKYTFDCYHIEYCILDKCLPSIEINIVIRETGAYVFVEDFYQVVETVNMEDFIWINFTMNHKIDHFKNEDIIKFKNNSIAFIISQKQAITKSITDNWQEQFKITRKVGHQIHTSYKDYSESNFPKSKDNKGEIKDDLEVRGNNSIMNEFNVNKIESVLHVLPLREFSKKKIEEINENLNNQPQESFKRGSELKKKKKSINVKKVPKKGNKKSKSISSTGEVAKLSLGSDKLIAGISDIFLEQNITEKTIKYVGVYAKASAILTDKQNMEFLPFIVSIKSVEDLPLSFIEELNLDNIYVQYEFSNVLQNIETEKVPVTGKNITLEDTRVFFLSEPDKSSPTGSRLDGRSPILKLQEALTTCMMVVKLYGERSCSEPVAEVCLFGEKLSDEFISTPGHEIFLNYNSAPKYGPLFLGSACFKLIQLLDGVPVVETSSVLTSAPVSKCGPLCDWNDLIEGTWDNKNRETLLNILSPRGLIPDSILLNTCTRITVRVSSPSNITHLSLNEQFSLPKIYHRIVLILNNQEYAFDLFKQFKRLNDSILGPMSEIVAQEHKSLKYNKLTDDSKKDEYKEPFSEFCNLLLNSVKELSENSIQLSPLDNIITGFFVDNKNECIIVLEGSPHLFFKVNEILNTMSLPVDVKVMFDNTLFFSQRLYDGLFPLLNIFYIQLKTSIDILLQHASHYFVKNVTEPSVQALLRLDMLRRSPTLACITLNQLFPTYEQLISFNISFGITDLSFSNTE